MDQFRANYSQIGRHQRDGPGREWLSDGLHPNATSEVQWRAAWVSWALASVY